MNTDYIPVWLAIVPVIIALVGIIALVMKYFVAAISKKDDQIIQQGKDFREANERKDKQTEQLIREFRVTLEKRLDQNTGVMNQMMSTMEILPDKIAKNIVDGVAKLLPLHAQQININPAKESPKTSDIIT